MKIRFNEWYGCRRDIRDPRDHLFAFELDAKLPQLTDLRPWCPPIMDQGDLGSCVTHGISVALRYLLKKNGKPDHSYSRLQLYYDARKIEGTIYSDSGLEIRDAIKCIAQLGVAHEDLWPYRINRFKLRPPRRAYIDAANYQALEYKRVEVSVTGVKAALAAGFPVIIGLSLFDSFESDEVARTGMVPMPDIHKEQNVGGHCMAAVGYGQHPGYITVQNSWADDWGDKGFCYLPESYIGSKDYGSDYWIVTKAEQ